VILLLVFVAFSDSVADGLWTRHGASLIVLTLAGTAGILGLVLFLTRYLAQRCSFTTEDEITTVFCGSKKTPGVRGSDGQGALPEPTRPSASSCCR
jgi:sodium/bile acid cotransporter 7